MENTQKENASNGEIIVAMAQLVLENKNFFNFSPEKVEEKKQLYKDTVKEIVNGKGEEQEAQCLMVLALIELNYVTMDFRDDKTDLLYILAQLRMKAMEAGQNARETETVSNVVTN